MRFHFRSFAAGLIVATVGAATVFAATAIKSATFNTNKIIFDGEELDLGSQQMISVVLDGETNTSNYMPVRGVLGAMGYDVSWDGAKNAVVISSRDTDPSALLGFWEGTQANGKSVIYYFYSDNPDLLGFITIYAEKDGEAEFKHGLYFPDIKASVLDCDYLVYNNNEIDENVSLDFRLSDDDNTLTLSIGGESLKLKKADAKLLTSGVKQVSSSDIAGTWKSAGLDGSSWRSDAFKFTTDGKIDYRTTLNKQDFAMSGTYKINGSLLSIRFTSSMVDGTVGEPLEIDLEESYAIGVKDGALYLYSGAEYYELVRE